MTYFVQFLFGIISTMGFAILFHVPKKDLFMSSIVGASGWVIFVYCKNEYGSALMGCFLAACMVGLLADILSKLFKETATVYIIPGIIPLVPGAGMYYTTLHLINGEIESAATTGTETLLMAGSISVGLLMVGSIFKMHYNILGKIKKRNY